MRNRVSCRIRFSNALTKHRNAKVMKRFSAFAFTALGAHDESGSRYVSAVTFCHQSAVNSCLPANVKPAALKHFSRNTRIHRFNQE